MYMYMYIPDGIIGLSPEIECSAQTIPPLIIVPPLPCTTHYYRSVFVHTFSYAVTHPTMQIIHRDIGIPTLCCSPQHASHHHWLTLVFLLDNPACCTLIQATYVQCASMVAIPGYVFLSQSHKKTARRTNLNPHTLSDLLDIQVDGPPLESFSPDQAILKLWWEDCKTTRRVNQALRTECKARELVGWSFCSIAKWKSNHSRRMMQ